MSLKSKLSTREIALLSLLSALWAAIEIYLGGFLKILKIPFSGTLLTFLGLMIIFSGRDAVPKRGSVLIMGVTTAFLKLIYLGGLAVYPIIGILIEAFLVEWILNRQNPKKLHYLLAGAAGLLWTFFHPFFAQGILAGWGLLRVYSLVIERGVAFLGIAQHFAWIVLSILILIHVLLGVLAGTLGWKFSYLILQRCNPVQLREPA